MKPSASQQPHSEERTVIRTACNCSFSSTVYEHVQGITSNTDVIPIFDEVTQKRTPTPWRSRIAAHLKTHSHKSADITSGQTLWTWPERSFQKSIISHLCSLLSGNQPSLVKILLIFLGCEWIHPSARKCSSATGCPC